MNEKYGLLKDIISRLDRVVVAFSGGVDSTLLLKTAVDVLGPGSVLAVNAGGFIYPESERVATEQLAQQLSVELVKLDPLVLDSPAFRDNPADRCYHCKLAIFGQMKEIAKERGFKYVLDGSNADDLNDYRPGQRACRELGVLSPLQQATLTKSEIRSLSHILGLPTWNKPSMACLASRFPYGAPVTKEKLQQVERAEELLAGLGFQQYRVRHHDLVARIEILPEDFHILLDQRLKIDSHLKALGFQYVSLDLLGYRLGAMNETLNLDRKRAD